MVVAIALSMAVVVVTCSWRAVVVVPARSDDVCESSACRGLRSIAGLGEAIGGHRRQREATKRHKDLANGGRNLFGQPGKHG